MPCVRQAPKLLGALGGVRTLAGETDVLAANVVDPPSIWMVSPVYPEVRLLRDV